LCLRDVCGGGGVGKQQKGLPLTNEKLKEKFVVISDGSGAAAAGATATAYNTPTTV
jgi:hypothetical protein